MVLATTDYMLVTSDNQLYWTEILLSWGIYEVVKKTFWSNAEKKTIISKVIFEIYIAPNRYMLCLRENKNENSLCREQSQDYLACRMEKGLMAQEEWSKLGFSDLEATKHKSTWKLVAHRGKKSKGKLWWYCTNLYFNVTLISWGV